MNCLIRSRWTIFFIFFLILSSYPFSNIYANEVTDYLKDKNFISYCDLFAEYSSVVEKSEFETEFEYKERLEEYFSKDPIRYLKAAFYKTSSPGYLSFFQKYNAETKQFILYQSLAGVTIDVFDYIYGSDYDFIHDSNYDLSNWENSGAILPQSLTDPGLCLSFPPSASFDECGSNRLIYITNPDDFSLSIDPDPDYENLYGFIFAKIDMSAEDASTLSENFEIVFGLKFHSDPMPVYYRGDATWSWYSLDYIDTSDYALLAELKDLTIYNKKNGKIYYHMCNTNPQPTPSGGGHNAVPSHALSVIDFPASVTPANNKVQVGNCNDVMIQPTLAIPSSDVGKTATLIMYIYLPDANFGINIPSKIKVLTSETKFDLLSNAIDFSDSANLNVYIYYGYMLGDDIKYNAYSIVVGSSCSNQVPDCGSIPDESSCSSNANCAWQVFPSAQCVLNCSQFTDEAACNVGFNGGCEWHHTLFGDICVEGCSKQVTDCGSIPDASSCSSNCNCEWQSFPTHQCIFKCSQFTDEGSCNAAFNGGCEWSNSTFGDVCLPK